MALFLFWTAGIATLAGATAFTLATLPRVRTVGMGLFLFGVLHLLIFWQAPALFCLAYLVAASSCLALFVFAIRSFPSTHVSLLSPHWLRHGIAILAIWGFSFAVQKGMLQIPVGAFRTSILSPDSNSLFHLIVGQQLSLGLLLFFTFVFFASGIKRLRENYPVGEDHGASS